MPSSFHTSHLHFCNHSANIQPNMPNLYVHIFHNSTRQFPRFNSSVSSPMLHGTNQVRSRSRRLCHDHNACW
ncbi:unnamed protein product [Caenorhabditis nigoni]